MPRSPVQTTASAAVAGMYYLTGYEKNARRIQISTTNAIVIAAPTWAANSFLYMEYLPQHFLTLDSTVPGIQKYKFCYTKPGTKSSA